MKFLLPLLFLSAGFPLLAQVPLISSGQLWKYSADGTDLGTAWRDSNYADASWPQGPTEIGYGDADEQTIVNDSPVYPTYYFRKSIQIPNVSSYVVFTLRVRRDDGIVVYVNGQEVARDNMPAGALTFNTFSQANASDDGNSWLQFSVATSFFVSGNNVVAAEIHQRSLSSSDISFDLELFGETTLPLSINEIRWGSSGNPLAGLTIDWTSQGTADSICYGYSTQLELGCVAATQRNAVYSGKKYYTHSFGSVNASDTLYYKLYDSHVGGWSNLNSFYTAPDASLNQFCFVGIGDSRSNLNMWNTISNLARSKDPDFVIYSGDIVANGGSTTDWQMWFDNGNNFISNELIYHSMGNHDENAGGSANYQNIFCMPNSGNTELYYSMRYGNTLFIALNSEDPSSTAQYSWLQNTLAQNSDALWKIVFFHRPFYTIGNHAGEMNGYFNTWWQAFDDYGVDIIVNGHDHMYERTKPINRNVSTTVPVSTYGSQAGEGRLQIVSGGAGAPLYTGTPNSFVDTYSSNHNFVWFCVNNNQITAEVYDDNNALIDTFSLVKGTVTKLQNIVKFNDIRIQPNPAKESFTLILHSENVGTGTIRITDITGRSVYTETIQKTNSILEKRVSPGHLPKGIYTVYVEIGNQSDKALLFIEP